MARSDDERDLAMLRDIQNGATIARAARQADLPLQEARRRLFNIRAADVRHDPDAAHFWAVHPLDNGAST
jgi:hypothetical protein